MWRRPLVTAGLCALVLAAYSNSFSAGFPFDNRQLILQDVRVHEASSANLDLILRHTYWWPYGESGLYRPLTTLSYLFNYAVLGNTDRPAGYHWFNLIVHLLNVVLVYALIVRLTRDRLAALSTATIWAVVPLSTEAVTNIVGRADLIAAFATLSALLMYLRARDATGIGRLIGMTGVAAMTLAGVFSKESAVMIVPLLALCEVVWWRRRSSVTMLIWTAAAAAAPLLLMWSQRAAVIGSSRSAEFAFVDNPIAGAGFWAGRLTAIRVMARYLSLVAWPATLSNDYSYAQIPLARGSAGDWMACAAVASFAAIAVAVFSRHRAAGFFAAFALVAFLPVSNLLFPTGTIMAERLTYLPSVGLVAFFTVTLVAAGEALHIRLAPVIIVALVVAGFAWRTWTRNADWRNDVTLWTAAVRDVPNSYKAHLALAEALYDADPAHGNLDQVIAEAERAVAIVAPLPDALTSLHAHRQAAAYYLDKAGGARAYERALAILKRCLRIIDAQTAQRPDASVAPAADVERLLAAAHLGLDNPGEALAPATRARALEPASALAYRLQAEALAGTRREDEAAIALMVGSMVTGDRGLGEALMALYRSGAGDSGCAVLTTASGPVLNPSCALVRQHMCAAAPEAIAAALRIGRPSQAEQFKSAAITQFGCTADGILKALPDSR